MKVLLVSQEMPPETAWGGIGTYVDVLSRALVAKGVEVHVLSVVDGQAPATRDQAGVVVHRFPLPGARRLAVSAPETWRRVRLSAWVLRMIRRLDLQPDVVECPEWMAEGLALGFGRSVPLVVRLHSSARQLFPITGQGGGLRGVDGRAAKWLEDVSARRAHVVVSTQTNLDEVAMSLRLDAGALHAIAYPIELPGPSPMRGDGPPRVVFVGRLEPRKGPDVLLAAAPEVLDAVPDARFVFVGRDAVAPGARPSSAWLLAEAERLGVAHAVELTGQLTRPEVDDALRRATVAAFPSRWESFGNVVAEASAVGRPVVVSSIPPFRELVEDYETGRIVPGDQPNAWAAALIDVLADRARAGAMGRAGAARIAAMSDPAKVADLALAAYAQARDEWHRGRRAGLPSGRR